MAKMRVWVLGGAEDRLWTRRSDHARSASEIRPVLFTVSFIVITRFITAGGLTLAGFGRR
jgi:hypothetical protein